MTRLGDFWKLLATKFQAKEAKMIGYFLGNFREKLGYFFTSTSGQTDCYKEHVIIIYGSIFFAKDSKSLSELAQFFWFFDEPLLFLYKHRPPAETLRAAFLSTSLIYIKQCSNATQWRKEGFLQIPPTLEMTEVESGTNSNRFGFFILELLKISFLWNFTGHIGK